MSLVLAEWWQEHVRLFEALIDGQDTPVQVYGRLHLDEDDTYHKPGKEDLLPLSTSRGPCVHVLMQPYWLRPQYSLRMAVAPSARVLPPCQGDPVGTVTGWHLDSMVEEQIGNAQAWYYPRDRFIVLWECFFYGASPHGDRPHRQPRIQHDPLMHQLWDAFEAKLRTLFPEAMQFASHRRDPITTDDDYAAFLHARGYRFVDDWALSKRVAAT
jgi:hypothetical protein